ncbi:MAG TPA: DNA polymerase III subunit gamma/tau C-terminal domain-containing protein, partial [Gammaproteobacteria bacterium]|nr:DNA polymerase III subunit gamma/tau C-terminal domain-containing protein [Gammaproteobacteria bacterium]
KERLEAALKTRFGDQIRVIMTVENPPMETPAQKKIREEKERQQAAEKAVKSDPTVKLLEETFDAVIDTKSIRPN